MKPTDFSLLSSGANKNSTHHERQGSREGCGEKKETKLTLDILTIGQMTLKCKRKEKKTPSIYILISNLSIALIHPCLAHSTKGCVYVCVCVLGQRKAGLPFFLWKRRESDEKGRANDNGRCFEVDKDIHYLSQSKDSSFHA